MSTCVDSPILPRLLVHQQGETFTVALDWSGHLADGETVSSAATEVERSPPDADNINRITLACQPTNIGVAMVVYRGDFPIPHNCLEPFTLTKITEPGQSCAGFPSTLPVYPV